MGAVAEGSGRSPSLLLVPLASGAALLVCFFSLRVLLCVWCLRAQKKNVQIETCSFSLWAL